MLRRSVTGVLVTAVASFGLVSGNQATAAPSASAEQDAQARKGVTRVVIAPKMLRKLRGADIKLAAAKPAKAFKFGKTRALRLPIAKHRKHLVLHRGGLILLKNKKHARATRLLGNYKKGRISALINGSNKRRYVFNARKSPYPKVGNIRLVLTRYTAGSLNDTFNTKRFERGDTFGYAKVRRRN